MLPKYFTAETTAANSEILPDVINIASMRLASLFAARPALTCKLTEDAKAEIKALLLYALSSSERLVADGASSTISTVVAQTRVFPLLDWPELVPALLQLIESDDEVKVTGGLKTVMKISQDAPDLMDQGGLSPDRPLNVLIPLFVKFFSHPSPALKQIALQSLTAYVELFPNALATNMNEVMQGLSSIASDPDHGTRKRVCEVLLTLFEFRSEYLSGQLPSICEFMIAAASDPHPPTSMKATEFWMTFFSPESPVSQSLREEIMQKQSAVQRVVPTLLKNIVYNEEERANILETNAEDEAMAEAGTARALTAPVHHKNKINQDEDDDDGEGFDDGEDSSWSLRKCSAGTLDAIASSSANPRVLLVVLLPTLQASLSSPDPWVREGAILALGAVAVRGCGQAIESEYLAQLYPFLISQLKDALPQVVATSAWTLARYCGWVVYQTESGAQPSMLSAHIEAIVGACGSVNCNVQNAAMTSFSAVIEVAGATVTPILHQIYQFLAAALPRYGGKALLTLYDTFGVLADTLGPAIGANGMADSWVPQLLEKWRVLHERSRSAQYTGDEAQALLRRELLPLLECIGESARDEKPSTKFLKPYIQPFFWDSPRSLQPAALSPLASITSHTPSLP